ncbi:MAG: DUF4118 domain-containing protein [Nostoc sp. ChiSLP02]|nr:DUF4118 domain-containing protein [Nostoc sp. DedSLP05]MDZ8101166.1 DUF4118 domain-containing protein [Nostoc sp. DedSLP01]MDZ8188320.1 DUF4118 domain-containing protein [Nostoc sp. ChiSLP02]
MRFYLRLLPYSVAIGSSAIALLFTLWLESLISRTIDAFFYIAIIVSTLYGGFHPGIVTVILSTLAIDYFLISPEYQIFTSQPEDILQLGFFLSVALIINLLTSNVVKSKHKVKQLAQKLALENAEQLQQQFEQQGLVMRIAQGIRPSLNLQNILQTTVDEVRQFLTCDRVTIFQFSSDRGGRVVVESVVPEWMAILPLQINDLCIDEENLESFKSALHERETTLRLFVQYAPAGIAMFDRDMRYLIVSQRWVDDHHLDSVASLIGRSACLEDLGGWDTLTAASGMECLTIAEAQAIDAILLDVSMPNMDGFAVYEQLQANSATQSIPVILLTAKVLPSDRAHFAQMGITGVVAKPFEPTTICQEVANIVG